MAEKKELLKKRIFDLVKEYYNATFKTESFIPGKTQIRYSAKVFDSEELVSLTSAALDFWLTTGPYASEFEHSFANYLDVKYASLVNSGSSANLLAVTSLTSPKLKDRRLLPGDEVITVASGFPTTLNPIIQNRLVPVFVDVEIPTYNIDVADLDKALSEKTHAIVLAHTLGNPFNLSKIQEFAEQNNLWLVEDCCDALGSTYSGKKVGGFGHVATSSFYPAHHITTGEGGCVMTNDPLLNKIVGSFRDWGRDCWCPPGQDNTCKNRFGWTFESLPEGYDHKYVYSHVGYNLKMTDLQAAIGVAQLKKLPWIVEKRKEHFKYLYDNLRSVESHFILPEATPESDPSWFGFPLAVKPESGLKRADVIADLEEKKIATRLLFGGNLLRQPAYRDIQYRSIGKLPRSDFVMNNVFWVGVWPGLTKEMMDYVVEVIQNIIRRR